MKMKMMHNEKPDSDFTFLPGIFSILFIFSFCNSITSFSQISHGGKPLEYGVESRFGLRNASDYFVDMPSFNIDSVKAIDDLPGNRIGGLKFAHTFFTDLTPENSGVTFYTDDGTKIWKVGIRSKGAYSLNVLFSEFLIPEKAEVYLYNSDRSCILGSFTNKNRPEGGEFSVSPVEGDELIVEYHEPPDAAFNGKIRISEVNHDYRGLFRSGTFFNQLNLPCLPDVSCESAYDSISGSVCLLIINGTTYCTGTLVNNTAQDGKPYLLTASHCLQNNASMGSRVVVYMNYQSPRCDKRMRGSEEFSLSGSVTKALSNEIDFALLELNEMPPADYRPYLSGWTTDTVTSGFSPFSCIHHPYGEVKKYCVEEDTLVKTDWTGLGDGIQKGNHWNVKKWEVGHTWTGSSGAPLFDKRKHIRGALSGGDSGGLSGCGSYISGDYFFRFDKAWDQYPDSSKQLKHWLDPLCPDSIRKVTTIDGMNPYSENPARRITNIVPGDSMSVFYLNKPYSGPVFGQNTLGIAKYAENFTVSDSVMIDGVYLMAAKGSKNTDNPVYVKVYRGGKVPGAVLGSYTLKPDYTDYKNGFITIMKSNYSNCENYIHFEKPVSAGKSFYIGYDVPYPVTAKEDSFYVYAAKRKDLQYCSSYFMNNSVWFPFSSHFSDPMYTSMWIEPVIQKDTLHYSDTIPIIDTDTVEKPTFVYMVNESMIYIWLPGSWSNNTRLDIYDMSGRIVKQTFIDPPLSKVSINARSRELYFLRFSCRGKKYTSKFMLYMQ